MTDPASLTLALLGWLRLFTCTDTPEDAGGVRCASFAAAVVSPPWRGGETQGGAFLAAVARAESQSSPVGVHARDTWAARTMYRRAVNVGWLTPETCPGHTPTSTTNRSGAGWGVRAAWVCQPLTGCAGWGPSGVFSGRRSWTGRPWGPSPPRATPSTAPACDAPATPTSSACAGRGEPRLVRTCSSGGAVRRQDRTARSEQVTTSLDRHVIDLDM